jgi:hypothetical protein
MKFFILVFFERYFFPRQVNLKEAVTLILLPAGSVLQGCGLQKYLDIEFHEKKHVTKAINGAQLLHSQQLR